MSQWFPVPGKGWLNVSVLSQFSQTLTKSLGPKIAALCSVKIYPFFFFGLSGLHSTTLSLFDLERTLQMADSKDYCELT